MEHYVKGQNVEPLESRETVLDVFRGLPEDFIWMRVQAGSKLRNVAGAAERALAAAEDGGSPSPAAVFSGHGAAVGKVVSCLEIVKRKFPAYRQYNWLAERMTEEFWQPKEEEEGGEVQLDPLKVVRAAPQVSSILASSQALTKS